MRLLRLFSKIVFCIFFVAACQSSAKSNQVCFKNTCYDVEVVYKTEDRARGLQFRRSLDKNKGMLFVFEQSAPYSFWMKDTWIPLDIIWLDYACNVVHIAHNVPPCEKDPCQNYSPQTSALYVLELNGGEAERLQLKESDQLEFRLREFLESEQAGRQE